MFGIQTMMDFLDISSLGVSYRNDFQIENEYKQNNKQDFWSTIQLQTKYGKCGPNS